MAKITFQPNSITREVSDNSALIDSCDRFDDVTLSFGCTEGSCGICELTILDGGKNCSPPNEKETDYLYPEDIDAGMRLGCQIKIKTGSVTLTWKSTRAKNQN